MPHDAPFRVLGHTTRDERGDDRGAVTVRAVPDHGPSPEPAEEPKPAEEADRRPTLDDRTGDSAAVSRMRHQARWVDLQIQEAMARGDFDDLPGAGKPLKDLGSSHDPDWWLKKLIEREQVTGVLPPSLALRKEDAELDDELDRCAAEHEVRRQVEEFNARVMHARYTPQDGMPPLITMPRDVEETVAAWRARRAARRTAHRVAAPSPEPPRRWWQRRRR